MNIHEYQAKSILDGYGVPILKGGVAYTPEEAEKVASEISEDGLWVVKAQIHAGGRGKAGAGLAGSRQIVGISPWLNR